MEKETIIKEKSYIDLHNITLNSKQLCDIELILNGAFNPLNGFLNKKDYNFILLAFDSEDGEGIHSEYIDDGRLKRFLEEGAYVIIVDIDEDSYKNNFRRKNNLLFVKADLTNAKEIENIFKVVSNKFNKCEL